MEKLQIPERLPVRNEFITGFGTREIRQLLLAALPGLLVVIIAFNVLPKQSNAQVLIFLCALLYWAGCYALIRRDENNMSVVAYVSRHLRFLREQHNYYYKQEKEVLYLAAECTHDDCSGADQHGSD